MTRDWLSPVLALVLLGATALAVGAGGPVRHRAPAISLEHVSLDVPGWTSAGPVPEDVVPADPTAPHHLTRSYQRERATVWVSVGYYPLQAQGTRPPAQELLLPSKGWTPVSERPVEIPAGGALRHAISANFLVMSAPNRRVAVLYWYQLPGRSVASDHWYRALLLYNRLVRRRADGGLVRVASPVPDGRDPATVLSQQASFVQAFYPEVLGIFPR